MICDQRHDNCGSWRLARHYSCNCRSNMSGLGGQSHWNLPSWPLHGCHSPTIRRAQLCLGGRSPLPSAWHRTWSIAIQPWCSCPESHGSMRHGCGRPLHPWLFTSTKCLLGCELVPFWLVGWLVMACPVLVIDMWVWPKIWGIPLWASLSASRGIRWYYWVRWDVGKRPMLTNAQAFRVLSWKTSMGTGSKWSNPKLVGIPQRFCWMISFCPLWQSIFGATWRLLKTCAVRH